MDIAASRGAQRILKIFFGLLVVFLYAPIVVLIIFSFNDSSTPAFPLKGFTWKWYGQFLSNPELLAALRTSAIVAVCTSVIAVSLGVMASIALVRRRFAGKAVVSGLLLSPLVIPYIVFGISLLILVQAFDRILVATLGVQIGLGIHTIVIGHVVLSLPYTMLVLIPKLEQINVSLEEAARDLGASGLTTFRWVTLPLLAPAIVSALLISFTLSFDEYAVASFVAGSRATYPIYLYSQLRFPVLLPQMIAVAVIVVAVSILIVLGAELGRRSVEARLEPGRSLPVAQGGR